MKRIILVSSLLLLISMSSSALAEWVKVAGNDKLTAYADPSTLRKKGNITKIWSLFDFRAENTLTDGSPYLSVMRETEYNCKDHVQHMLSYSIYSGNMGKGKLLDKGGDPQDWKPVSQSGMAMAMMEYACSKD